MKKNSTEMGGIATLIIGIIVCAWTSFAAGLKTCCRMIFSMFKSARRFVTAYLTGTDEDRSNLINSLVSTLKTSAMALAIVLVSGVCIRTLFDALIRARFTFIPGLLMDAIGYLSLGLLLRVVVRLAEKLSVRTDVTNKVRKLIEFGMSAMVPLAIWSFLDYATAEGISLILSCCIASLGYRKINEIRAAKAIPAAN